MKKPLIITFIFSGFIFSFCGNPYHRKPILGEKLETQKMLISEIKENPKDDTNHQALGIFYFQHNFINKALFHLEMSVKLNSKNFEALAWLGAAKTKKGREVSGWYCFGLNKISWVKEGCAI